jgi:hypothetical protein
MNSRAPTDIEADGSSRLTILTTTSPIRSNPSVRIITRAIESLINRLGLLGCRHLIVCDGCEPYPSARAAAYDAYKERLKALQHAGILGTRVEVLECPTRMGLSGVVLSGMARIDTPYLLFHEHDWEVTRPVDVDGILQTFENWPQVHHIRLNVRTNVRTGWDFVLEADKESRPVPLLRTSSWSSNPHFARVSYYRSSILPRLTNSPDGGAASFEGPIFRAAVADIRAQGFESSHQNWGTFVYGSFGDPPIVSHLDGRMSIS